MEGTATEVITTVEQQTKPEIVTMTLKPKQNVHWREDTIDNEFLNKRKSKVCCIFERPKLTPDDTSSCSGSSDSDAGNNYDKFPSHQRKAMKEQAEKKKKKCSHHH